MSILVTLRFIVVALETAMTGEPCLALPENLCTYQVRSRGTSSGTIHVNAKISR